MQSEWVIFGRAGNTKHASESPGRALALPVSLAVLAVGREVQG